METVLQEIITFADQAHGEQKRKYTPERYIVHPVRVMEVCKRITNDICILAAALLHDVLEDTTIQKNELEGFLKKIMSPSQAMRTMQLVVDLTDVFVKKDFPQLNRRARKAREISRLEKTSPDSQTIKYADIIDNTTEIVKHDPDFARIFLYECRAILLKINKGNQELYTEALRVVAKEITALKK